MKMDKITPRIAVILSSYNGNKYIIEQVNSLLKLKGEFSIDIHIRDDGSEDGTQKLLKENYSGIDRFFLHEGENVGVIKSFLWLVESVAGYDYYAFCDQDDIWEPLKLMAAVSKLEQHEKNTPLVYCSAYDYVDHELSLIGRFQSYSDLSVNNLLIENCAPGCTMVFNSALRDKYCELKIENIAQRIVMHDWFIMLLGLSFGTVVYDHNSYLLYRQHGNNVVGKKTGFREILKSKIKQFRKERKRPEHLLYSQVALIAECCTNDINNKVFRLSDKFVKTQSGFFARLKFAVGGNIKRVKLVDDIIFKSLFILGYYK
jgi:glycosyltransferase involved in cell wall biosynthesis